MVLVGPDRRLDPLCDEMATLGLPWVLRERRPVQPELRTLSGPDDPATPVGSWLRRRPAPPPA